MADQDPNRETTDSVSRKNPIYDNWPIEGSDEDVRYIGLMGGTGDTGSPMLYQETTGTLYEGSVDEENERLIVDEESAREVDSGETITETLTSITDEFGLESLSAWTREHLGDGAEDVEHGEFQKRNVPDDADHDYGFWGSYTYDDETGRVHTIERLFKIYTDPSRRENGNPVAAIKETHLVAEAPQEERRAGDAEEVDQTTYELVINMESDVEREHEEGAVHDWCRDWHRSHLEQRGT